MTLCLGLSELYFRTTMEGSRVDWGGVRDSSGAGRRGRGGEGEGRRVDEVGMLAPKRETDQLSSRS